jgi:hypothetical protein
VTEPADPRVDRALAAYRAPPAPAGLADSVIDRLAGARRRGSRRRWWILAAVVAAAVLAAAGGAAWIAARDPATGVDRDRGRIAAAERETIRIGGRATVVVEPGADLRWHATGDGDARIEQTRGSAFYRVERGGAFVVETPAGTVEVRGTCFRVEVMPMSKLSRQHVVGAGLGAVLAAAIVVVVYEGGVRVVNAHGHVDLAAGERGAAATGGAPVRDLGGAGDPIATGSGAAGAGGDPAALATLSPEARASAALAQAQAARDELAAANAMIDRLQRDLAEARGDAGEPSAAAPSEADLAAWAQRCEVHIDAPAVMGAVVDPVTEKDAAQWGMASAEIPAFNAALSALHGVALAELREIYIAATGNPVVADELTPGAMFGEILDKALAADVVNARRRMARERAGLQPPPVDLTALPPVERALRLIYRLGNDLEAKLAESIGPARAKLLRRDAWPGLRLDQYGCEVE